jgi:hypothetical protein
MSTSSRPGRPRVCCDRAGPRTFPTVNGVDAGLPAMLLDVVKLFVGLDLYRRLTGLLSSFTRY